MKEQQMIYLFSNEQKEQLLREFCSLNGYSYYMFNYIAYDNLLGEKDAEEFDKEFKCWLSGKLSIPYKDIYFADSISKTILRIKKN